jgi:hypothetical protein
MLWNVASFLQTAIIYTLKQHKIQIELVEWMDERRNEWTQNTLQILVSISKCVHMVDLCDFIQCSLSPNQLKYVM